MKKIIYFISLIVWGLLPLFSNAQIFNSPPPASSSSGTPPPFSEPVAPGPPGITDTPIDGGVVFLIIIGVALTVRRLRIKQNGVAI